MDNEIQTFEFEGNSFRTLADGDDPAAMTLRVQTTGGGSTFALTGLTVTAGSNGSADVTLTASSRSRGACVAPPGSSAIRTPMPSRRP